MSKHYNCGKDNPSFGKPAWNRGVSQKEETKLKISRSLVGNKRRLGILHTEETKRKIARPGKSNANWKSGRFIDGDGYVRIWKPHHHRADHKGYVFEHILIACEALGRPLKLGIEVVHHINGIKNDNRHGNLLICSKSYHYWLHAKMSQLYQREHFLKGDKNDFTTS